MIPIRDTVGDLGPVRGTLVLLLLEVLAYALGVFGAGFWALLVALLGTWLFGAPLEGRLGTARFLLAAAALTALAGLVAGLIDGTGSFLLYPLGAVLGLGLLLIAIIPRARILVLSPIPFAMGFQEVPAPVVLVVWTVLAWLAS
ncbi:MAG: rhomboid family intramembrane serine protease [Solirubrobacterales bacterium]|nr:rhomboid family intramembrane serine protease [Solirubrobacterales bacterium]